MVQMTHKIPGQMPKLWDRQVIFFANILSLFFGNDEEADVLRKEVGALETYGSRLVPLLNLMFQGEDNLLILQSQPDDILLEYFRKQLNLSLPKVKTLPYDVYTSVADKKGVKSEAVQEFIQILKDHPAQWMDGYVTDDVINRLAKLAKKKTICHEKGSLKGNNKLLLHQHLEKRGLPIFETRIAKNKKEVTKWLGHLYELDYRWAVVKAPIGASGIGIQKIDLAHSNGALNLPNYLFFEGKCMVQGWMDSSLPGVNYIGSPSVQMFLSDDEVSLFDITDQILSPESVHEGNMSPPDYLKEDIQEELMRQGEEAGSWLHSQGYRGTASTDFHLIKRDGKCEIRICEINARVTGATYPSILARHFMPTGAWLMRNIRFAPAQKTDILLKELNKAGLLYKPSMKEGVLPFNFNPDSDGGIVKGQFLFLGESLKDVRYLLGKLTTIEAIKGDFDRD